MINWERPIVAIDDFINFQYQILDRRREAVDLLVANNCCTIGMARERRNELDKWQLELDGVRDYVARRMND